MDADARRYLGEPESAARATAGAGTETGISVLAASVFLAAFFTAFLFVTFLVAILILLLLPGPSFYRVEDNYPLRFAKSCMKSTKACTPVTGMAL